MGIGPFIKEGLPSLYKGVRGVTLKGSFFRFRGDPIFGTIFERVFGCLGPPSRVVQDKIEPTRPSSSIALAIKKIKEYAKSGLPPLFKSNPIPTPPFSY
jgi:hypothetical protein